MSTVSKNKFRDKISTIDEKGNRSWIYVKKVRGKFFKYRTILSWFLIAFLVLAPFVKVKGHQFLMFNVLERRFNIFGFPFWPQDFHLFVISMIIAVIFVAFFTVAFGRLGLPADHLFGNGFPKNRILDRGRQRRSNSFRQRALAF